MSEVKYGYRSGPQCMVEGALGASEVFKFKGGAWMKSDAAGYLDIAGSGDGELIGWFQTGEFTAQATNGLDKGIIDISCNSIYRMPADATPALTDRWETCDLVVTGGDIQQADVGESSEDVIQIVAFDAVAVTVDVRMNPSKVGSVGVA